MRIEDLGRVRFPESMEEALSKINPNGLFSCNNAENRSLRGRKLSVRKGQHRTKNNNIP